METAKIAVAIAAVLISIASLIIAQRSAARAKKAQAITHLLGEKETVAFAAIKLLRDGLPARERERTLVIAALLQATVFEGSDRARALLYRVIELNGFTARNGLSLPPRQLIFISLGRSTRYGEKSVYLAW